MSLKKLAIASILLPISVFANDDAHKNINLEIIELKHRITELEKLLEKSANLNKKENLTSKSDNQQSATDKPKSDNIIQTEISDDQKPTIKVGGKIEFDSGKISKDKFNKGSGFNVRTARINVGGKVNQDWKYKMEVDFNNDKTSLKKAYLDYVNLGNNEIRIGKFNHDFGMNTENKFPESSIITSLISYNSDGVRLARHGDNYYSSIGYATTSLGKAKKADEQARTAFLRGSYALLHDDLKTVHVGASASHYKPRNLAHKIEYEQNFETNLSDQALKLSIDKVRYVKSYAGDFGIIYGPFSFQAEYIKNKLVRPSNIKNNYFDGGYAQVAYSLTKEKRGYNPRDGEFLNIEPTQMFNFANGNYGAWEIAYRYSYLNLNSNGLNGGKLKSYSTSLNWYINNYMHLRFNYIIGHTDKHAVNPNNKPRIFLIRTHISF